ncbi:MAG TPA: TolC family protein [Vicinamibacterales bacterium]|nr:TolC family protein [Vicinamibacterales bacterium]
MRTAPAQPAALQRYIDEARGLTIEDLVALALKAPSILASRARVDMARGDLAQAGLRPNPTASFERRDEIGGADNQLMAGITWPLDLSRKSGRTDVARQQLVGAEQVAADLERQLAATVRRQASRLLAAVRQLEIQETISNAARQTRELLAARAESGAGLPLERDIADVEWRRAEADLARQRAGADTALAELRALVGLPAETPLFLSETLEAAARRRATEPPSALDAAAIARTVDARPDVRAAESQIALAAARTDLLRRDARPDVSLIGSYMRMDAGFSQLGLDAGGQAVPIRGVFHNATFGAMVSLPWRNRQQGAIAASTAAESAARHDLEALRLSVSAQIDAARVREEQAGRVWEIYSGGLRDLAAKNLEVTRESHRLGRATLVQVLAETRRYLEVETAYTGALLDTLDARFALASALGVIR